LQNKSWDMTPLALGVCFWIRSFNLRSVAHPL
jgi:hypothetical protein